MGIFHRIDIGFPESIGTPGWSVPDVESFLGAVDAFLWKWYNHGKNIDYIWLWLVVTGTMELLYDFPNSSEWNVMIPTDELPIIFQRGRSTTNQIIYFPFHIWDVILPIDEVHHFSRWLNHQAVVFYPTLLVLVIFFWGVFGGSRHHLNQTMYSFYSWLVAGIWLASSQ